MIPTWKDLLHIVVSSLMTMVLAVVLFIFAAALFVFAEKNVHQTAQAWHHSAYLETIDYAQRTFASIVLALLLLSIAYKSLWNSRLKTAKSKEENEYSPE